MKEDIENVRCPKCNKKFKDSNYLNGRSADAKLKRHRPYCKYKILRYN